MMKKGGLVASGQKRFHRESDDVEWKLSGLFTTDVAKTGPTTRKHIVLTICFDEDEERVE